MSPQSVAAIDLGSRQNLGWAIKGSENRSGTDIDSFVEVLAKALEEGSLALGFEAPMFVPVHSNATSLTRGRNGESDRPFSASAGSTVLVTGLVVVPYILSMLKRRVPQATATFDWREPLKKSQLLLFEAFVTHQPKDDTANPHIRDAQCAVERFCDGVSRPELFKSAVTETSCFSLLGSILLLTDWTKDLAFLKKECLVVRHKGTSN